jgi:hypothetical protein
MKEFRVQIRAYGYYGDFRIMSEDDPISIENAIVDKLGKNDIVWEEEGFYNSSIKYITYEEVIKDNDATTSTGSIQTEKVTGSTMGAGAS